MKLHLLLLQYMLGMAVGAAIPKPARKLQTIEYVEELLQDAFRMNGQNPSLNQSIH